MKRILIVTIALLVGVAAFAADWQVQGVWQVNILKMIEDAGQLSAMKQAGMTEDMITKNMSMTIELKSDGTWVWTRKTPQGEEQQTGTWKETGRDGDTVTVQTTDQGGEAQEINLSFTDANQVTADHGEGPDMHMTRKE